MGEFYDHGVDMASEIPTSEKADGFNQYWTANHKGEPGKSAARKEYNRGWRDYKTGKFTPEPSIWPLVVFIGGGVAIYMWLTMKKQPQTGVAT